MIDERSQWQPSLVSQIGNRRAERISGMDGWHLYQETDLQVANGLSIFLLDRSKIQVDIREHVLETLRSRLHLLPTLRKVLYDPWFNPDRPMLVAGEVNLADHVETIPMPEPGGQAGAEKAFAQIRATHLDRSKPLWRMYLLDEPCSDYIYLVSVSHHVLVDGDSATDVFEHYLRPGDLGALAPKPLAGPDSFPMRPEEVIRDGLARKMRRLRRLPYVLKASLRAARGRWATRKLKIRVPRTSLNCSLSGISTSAFVTLPLVDLQRIARAHSVTINHVLLCCVGGALRNILEDKGERPERPLVAAVPYAMRSADTSNYVTEGVGSTTVLRIGLYDNISDPVARLLALAEHARVIKDVQQQRGVNLFRQWTEYAPGRAFNLLMRTVERFSLAERMRWPCNVIVSNASGFVIEEPVFLNIPALQSFPAGPLLHGMGPSIIALSWGANLCLSVTADRRHVEHASTIAQYLQSEFRALSAQTHRPATQE